MEQHIGPDLDIEAVRDHYRQALAQHIKYSQRLEANRVDVRPADFGRGFGSHGARIVEALERLHTTTQGHLASRVQTWESMLQLVDDIEERDSASADQLGGVMDR